jgi:hypothetical protein
MKAWMAAIRVVKGIFAYDDGTYICAHIHVALGTGNCDRTSQAYRCHALTIVANVVGTEISTRKCLGQKTE